jgi:hypothetical protein
MGKKISVQLGDEYFETKSRVTERMRQMLKAYPIMGFVIDGDMKLCLALFSYHPNYQSKTGAGVEAIQVRLDDYGNRYLHLHRKDGSDIDISWTWCVSHIK